MDKIATAAFILGIIGLTLGCLMVLIGVLPRSFFWPILIPSTVLAIVGCFFSPTKY